MTRAHEQRVKNSLERTRVKLKQREIELLAAEKALTRDNASALIERAETIALLQLLCEQHGLDRRWDPKAPLPEIIERHLLGPLLEQRTAAPPTAPVRAPTAPAATPRPKLAPTAPEKPPRRLQALPPSVHRVMVVEAQDQAGRRGSSCRCTCGWISWIAPTAAEAWRLARDHETQVSAAPAAQAGVAVRQGGSYA
jgi:hypothetical protein